MTSRIPRIEALFAAFAALALPGHGSAAAGGWSVYETSREGGHRLTSVPEAPAQAGGPKSAATIVCVPSQRFQAMVGFGGALTESSGWVLAKLTPEARAEVLKRYYDPSVGIGYTLARTHINSCDFSLGVWALDPVDGDTKLEHFSLEPMRRWVLPLIHEAQTAAGAANFHLLASPWSPPAWMKTNGQMAHGGGLKPEDRQAWADYLVRFIHEMGSEENIPVWALTVQNEPAANQTWESCIYSAGEERDFVRDHLGPALALAGLQDVHLCVLDHNRDLFDEWTKTIYGDREAARYVWGTAMHWYVSEDYAAGTRAHSAFPDKAILFTEGCCDRGEEAGPWSVGRWEHGERYAHSMINDFKNWVCGWIDWNIALDQEGGPNHVGNFCDAPVIVDTKTLAVSYQSSYYYIGHFSRFVHPGAVRIESHGGPAGLESVAFQNADGTVAVVVLNTGSSPVGFGVDVGSGALSCAIPGHSIQTYVRTP